MPPSDSGNRNLDTAENEDHRQVQEEAERRDPYRARSRLHHIANRLSAVSDVSHHTNELLPHDFRIPLHRLDPSLITRPPRMVSEQQVPEDLDEDKSEEYQDVEVIEDQEEAQMELEIERIITNSQAIELPPLSVHGYRSPFEEWLEKGKADLSPSKVFRITRMAANDRALDIFLRGIAQSASDQDLDLVSLECNSPSFAELAGPVLSTHCAGCIRCTR